MAAPLSGSQHPVLPRNFPSSVSVPKYAIGDRVRFIPLPAEAFGTIIGLEYSPAEHLQDWSWRYIIWLDPQSPGSTWTCSDLAWEDDLEQLMALAAPSTEQSA